MDAHTLGWLAFLCLMIKSSCLDSYFKLGESLVLTAKEGSCVEIKCEVTGLINDNGAYWLWLKDAKWLEKITDFWATTVYSSKTAMRDIDERYKDRVKYLGSSSLRRSGDSGQNPLCGIRICDLKMEDSGKYSIRVKGSFKWITEAVTLVVEANPCLITFAKPQAVTKFGRITLSCSTPSSCPSAPQIQDLTQGGERRERTASNKKITEATIAVNWRDDGRVFSCQTHDNTDIYLIRNVSVSVEYSPRELLVSSPENVLEGDSVLLTCSAKGNPSPSLFWSRPSTSWSRDYNRVGANGELKIPSIQASQSGKYSCRATNGHGSEEKDINIYVTYKPTVSIQISSPRSTYSPGKKIVVRSAAILNISCHVVRGEPRPGAYAWFRDGRRVGESRTLVRERLEPEDAGIYTCTATNRVGAGTSGRLPIEVQYGPRKTAISLIGSPGRAVKVESSVTLSCHADANPAPSSYSWYRGTKETVLQQWSYLALGEKYRLAGVRRSDATCYWCKARNFIDVDFSEPLCLQVLYPPDEPTLSTSPEVTEGQALTVTCRAESFPPSTLNVSWAPPAAAPPLILDVAASGDSSGHTSALQHTFNVTYAHAGSYSCVARNSEGSRTSVQRKLVVKYAPKKVTVKSQSDFVVKENTSLTLTCDALSYPSVTAVTWMKRSNGKDVSLALSPTFTIKSVSPSDSGIYICAAANAIGEARSPPAEVRVKYAPKHTNIARAAEKQERDGRSSAMLTCHARSYPLVDRYAWFKRGEGKGGDEPVSKHQNYTVYSDRAGVYYCIAGNEINQQASDPVHMFMRDFRNILMVLLLCLAILFIIFSSFFVYRYKKKKRLQQGTTNRELLFGFLGRWNGSRRGNLMEEPVLAEPFRGRDGGPRRQPFPDDAHRSGNNTASCPVNPTHGNKTRPTGRQDGRPGEDSHNYATLNFCYNQSKGEEDSVYSMVSKPENTKKIEQEMQEDYENASAALGSRCPNRHRDTNEEEDDDVELTYSQVKFSAAPRRPETGGESSSSEEDDTYYSEVKIR